jgi:hypothetical protein
MTSLRLAVKRIRADNLAKSAAIEKWLSTQLNHPPDPVVPTAPVPDRLSLVGLVIFVTVFHSIGTLCPYHPTGNQREARKVREYGF